MSNEAEASALEMVKALVDMHETEKRAALGGANYDDVRKVTRESAALWERAHVMVHGPREVDNKPRNEAERKRWDANAKRVQKSREKDVA